MIAPDASHGELKRGNVGKHLSTVLAELAKLVVGKLAIIVARVLSGGENVDHFAWSQRHHRVQHDAVDQRKNRGINAYRERQRQYRYGREPRRLEKLPDRKLEILDHENLGLFSLRCSRHLLWIQRSRPVENISRQLKDFRFESVFSLNLRVMPEAPTTAPPPLPKSQPSFGKRHSTIIKLLGVGALVLILLIPLLMITGVLTDRLQRRNEAVTDITSSWGKEQSVIGPVLGIPYQYKFKAVKEVPTPDGRVERREVEETGTANAYFLPERLNVSGDVQTQKLHRGIYEAVVYRAQTVLSGKFAPPDFGPLKIDLRRTMEGCVRHYRD